MSWSREGGEGNRRGTCGEWAVPLVGRWVQTPLRGLTSVLLAGLLGFSEPQLPRQYGVMVAWID